jgi:ceramide glucosyltransferase
MLGKSLGWGLPERVVHQLVHFIGWGCVALSVAGAVYALLAAAVLGRFAAAPAEIQKARPAVTLLKPLHFDSPGLEGDLDTFLEQDYGAPIQIVFGVQSEADPAIAVVRHLMARHPGVDMTLVIDTRSYGSNAKVSNLINMAEHAKHDVLVLSDSDIAVPRDWLSRLVDLLGQPGVGAVTCPYTGGHGNSAWSTLAAMGTSYEFLPNMVFGTWWGVAHACLGSTIALTRATLNQIGGFDAFANYLADDYEMGRAIRHRGQKVVVAPFAVTHRCTEETARELLSHELRWSRTVRIVRPWSHPTQIITHPLPLALLSWALLGGVLPVAMVLFALLARVILRNRVEKTFGGAAGPVWLLPVRDIISFAVFVLAYFGQNVAWRGSRFQVRPSGAMSEI